MINWRKPVISAALRVTRSDVPDNLRTIRRLWRSSPEAVERYQARKLTSLLRHAHATVPYYNDVLEEAGVVDGEGTVHLEKFSEIPLLTKEILRDERERLLSNDPGPEPYTNSTAGSTGEPTEFVQDRHYWEWNVATKLFYQRLAGKPLGGREIKLWGSERDVESRSEPLKSRAIDFLYNRRTLNAFRMGEGDMAAYVETINSFRPKTIWAYVESIHQLAKFVDRTDRAVHSPDGVVTTANTLREPTRETIESVFDTRVFDQYGSREVGDIACECSFQDGLHVFPHATYLEIVDEEGRPLPAGEHGSIAVTSLTNRSMPMIRYEIGDMGIAEAEGCRCGRPFPTLDALTGREIDHFLTPTGDLVNPGYLEKEVLHLDWVEKFQIRQISRDHVHYSIVPYDGRTPTRSELGEIERATHRLFEDDVEVSFEFPSTLLERDSGKFQYSISEVLE